jgi:Zn finger protein HypA/HybF involved in hydrogenase expression
MVEREETTSPLKEASGSAGPHATRAFELLANETRLAILLALWEAHEPHAEEVAVSFSELRDRVGLRDSGQFNYHLGKLQGRYLRKGEEGYQLTREGLLLVQSIIAGTGIEEPSLEPTPIEAACEHCGAQTAVTYENVYVYQICTECEGGGFGPEHPTGALTAWTFEPTGLTNRTAEGVFTASTIKNLARIAMRFEEICPECSGPVEWELDLCDAHDVTDSAVCPNCGRDEVAVVRETCTVCKSAGSGTPAIKVLLHPAVISFFYDHGIEVGFTGSIEFDDVLQMLTLAQGFDMEVISVDPQQLRISMSRDGDVLSLEVDGQMNVNKVIKNNVTIDDGGSG